MTDRSILVRVKGDLSDLNRALLGGAASAKAFTGSLDSSTDRMGNLVQTSLALGPALVPIGAVAVPAISGLTNQLAFAAAGAGVAALAFSGVGDALKATNDFAIDPTAANLEKMQQSLSELGPAGREFVGFLQEIRPELQGLQNVAQEGLFPGAEAGIRDLMKLLPQAERIVSEIAGGLGQGIAEAGDNLNDPRWVEFFTFLENEARPTLVTMGRTVGNLAEGFANLWMAFDPLSDDFSASVLQMSRDFARWTDGLDETEGFQEFVDYINANGPQAWDTLTSIANAGLQIVQAAAPVGAVALPVIEALADTLAVVADSPAGPVLIGAAAGISAISRAVALYNVANGSAMGSFLTKVGGSHAGLKAAGAAAGIFALSLTDLDEKMGLSNTATFALAGAVAGPWGAAAGAGIGLTMDLANANDGLWTSISRANSVISNGTSSIEEQSAALADARSKVLDLKAATNLMNDAGDIDLSPGNLVRSAKNNVEDLFGRSDVQEAEAALAKLEEQQAKNVEAAMSQQFAEAGMSSAMAGATAKTREQTSAILNLIAEHNALTDATLASSDANIAYEQALDDAAKAGREGKDGLDANTQAGRDNLTLLNRLAGGWNNLSSEQQNAKGASERARSEFIAIAIQMGATRKKAEELADEYLDIPTDVSTNVKTNAPKVTAQVRSLIKALQDIPGLTETTIRTIKDTFIVPPHSDPKVQSYPWERADGGEITGPGGPRDDLIPIMASNKEIMVNAADAQEHRDLLLGINAGLFRGKRPQMYAYGGEVGRVQRMTSGAPSGASAPATTLSASIVGARVAVDKDGLMRFVDGRVEVGVSQSSNYAGAR